MKGHAVTLDSLSQLFGGLTPAGDSTNPGDDPLTSAQAVPAAPPAASHPSSAPVAAPAVAAPVHPTPNAVGFSRHPTVSGLQEGPEPSQEDLAPGLLRRLCGEWRGVIYTKEGEPSNTPGKRNDDCTCKFKLSHGHDFVEEDVPNRIQSLDMTFTNHKGTVLEGLASLVKDAAQWESEDGFGWNLTLRNTEATSSGSLFTTGGGRGLVLRMRTPMNGVHRDECWVDRFGFTKVDHAFEEQAQPCKASEAMRHAIMADAEKPSGDNRVIQSLWIGDTLSSLEHCAIKSWLAHGHEVRRSMFEEWDARQLMPTQVHLYTFNPALRHVPDGVVLKDAEVIISNDTVKRKYNHVQTFADLFRYEMLRALGGWWVDLDLILLRPLTHLHPYCFAMELEDGIPKVTNCALKCPAESPLLDYCLAECQSKDDIGQAAWLEIGPVLLHKAVNMLNFQKYTVPYYHFCPIPYAGFLNPFVFTKCNWPLPPSTADRIRDEETTSDPPTPTVFGIHCYNSLWSFAKDTTFSQDSLYEVLKAHYQVPKIGPPLDQKMKLLLSMAHMQSTGSLDLKAMMQGKK